MRHALYSVLIICISILLNFGLCAASPSSSVFNDASIHALLSKAEINFDFNEEDAVILYSACSILERKDGVITTNYERWIWLKSEDALNRNSDLHIHVDSEFEEISTRQGVLWVEGKFDTLEGGIIPKHLPSNNLIRLQISNISAEFPLIFKSEVQITDNKPFREGHEGVYNFARDIPVQFSLLEITVPAGDRISTYIPDETSTISHSAKDSAGYDAYQFTIEGLHPIGHTTNLIGVPNVEWSTWKDWDEYGSYIKDKIEKHKRLSRALRDSVRIINYQSYTPSHRAKLIASFISSSTECNHNIPVIPIWETKKPASIHKAYKVNRLDRVVYAAALFQEAGFMTFPVLRSSSFQDINNNIPTTGNMEGIALWVSGGSEVEAYYDPMESRIYNGLSPIYNRTIWLPGSGDDPAVSWNGAGSQSNLELKLRIKYDKRMKSWVGTGFYNCTQGFNQFDRMEGVEGETKRYLQSVIKGLFPTANVVDFSPVTFNRFVVSVGFQFEVPVKKYKRSKIRLAVENPGDGISDRLESTESYLSIKAPLSKRIPWLMSEFIEITIDLTGLELDEFPDDHNFSNEIGSYKFEAKKMGNSVTLERMTELNSASISFEDIDDLVLILNALRNSENRLVSFRIN